ncbi:hypothetical protein KR018_003356 [Drosophila ironensis]|nr:hypothetical protein KR018_003356 [Drosophila ironensis]
MRKITHWVRVTMVPGSQFDSRPTTYQSTVSDPGDCGSHLSCACTSAAASGGASRVASQSKVDKKPESTTYREELEKFNRYRETINRARMSPLEGYRLWRDEQNVEEHDKAQAMCKTTESGVMVPTRSCSPVQELPPGVRYLVEGRTAFSQIESPLSKPKVPPLDAPSTSSTLW